MYKINLVFALKKTLSLIEAAVLDTWKTPLNPKTVSALGQNLPVQ